MVFKCCKQTVFSFIFRASLRAPHAAACPSALVLAPVANALGWTCTSATTTEGEITAVEELKVKLQGSVIL